MKLLEGALVRTARLTHHCCGGYDQSAQQRIPCNDKILKGERYIEYVGESAVYQSGKRYHLLCALQQGLIDSAM